MSYVADNWALAPDGGRAATRGLYRAVVPGLGSCEGYGANLEQAIEQLASQIAAYVEADGYACGELLRAAESRERQILRAAMRGTLAAGLLAVAGEPVLVGDDPSAG